MGARSATCDAAGHAVFSQPEPFTKIPLSFAYACGGRDTVTEGVRGIPGARHASFLPPGTTPEDLSPYVYPRNPCGRGFLVEATRASVETLQLPQLEDPDDRLDAARLAAVRDAITGALAGPVAALCDRFARGACVVFPAGCPPPFAPARYRCSEGQCLRSPS